MGCCVMEKEIISKYNNQLRAKCYGVISIMSRFCMKASEENVIGKKKA